ncbi:uncharacterized protein Pyn_24738 [Prunus yedoensis var. nudiflora]|uniref:Uncharacterized protein n=1 Tax=Prunus yedoensis var. nudiflora TaxID=2094558 RepID=A0A314ZKU0_PRUYE|nr:uncharacterized protein Pyn_24738 [Prunus yedoensis var. nudiflora]
MRRGEVVTQQCNPSACDRDLLMWLRSNCVDYPFRSSINCPQQDPCRLAMMYIMKTLSKGKALDPVFLPGAMKNMRAHVLQRFINDDECSWDASTFKFMGFFKGEGSNVKGRFFLN